MNVWITFLHPRGAAESGAAALFRKRSVQPARRKRRNAMKRLIVALALAASLGMAGNALALDKKINIFNGAQYDIYTLYLSPTNANDWEENLLKQETLPNGDKVDIEVSRTEKAEAWDVKVTNKAGETMTWIGVPLNKAGQITLLPDGKYEAR